MSLVCNYSKEFCCETCMNKTQVLMHYMYVTLKLNNIKYFVISKFFFNLLLLTALNTLLILDIINTLLLCLINFFVVNTYWLVLYYTEFYFNLFSVRNNSSYKYYNNKNNNTFLYRDELSTYTYLNEKIVKC